LFDLLRDLEKEIETMGQDARGGDMQVFDPATMDDLAAEIGDDKGQERTRAR